MGKSTKFAKKVVEDGRFILTDALDNFEISYPCIGIEYLNWSWKKILENFEEIQNYAQKNNLKVSQAPDGSKCLVFEYIGISNT